MGSNQRSSDQKSSTLPLDYGARHYQYDCISRHLYQYATSNFFEFCSQNGRRQPFWMTENHFRSHFSPFQINTQLLFWIFFTKWQPAAILDDRKNTFYRISRHFRSMRNFIFIFIFFAKWPPAAILDDRKSLLIAFGIRFLPKSIGTSLYSMSVATSNMKLIGAFLIKL